MIPRSPKIENETSGARIHSGNVPANQSATASCNRA